MPLQDSSKKWFLDWFLDCALPLWSNTGIDPATKTAWEALDHLGRPLVDLDRRLRVQARQAYVFAKCADIFDRPDLLETGHYLFRFVIDHGFCPKTGNLASTLHPDMTIKTALHDLYDLAFALLAASAFIGTKYENPKDLKKLDNALSRLKATRGWYENAAHSLPRRQNPHMHLFEAMTELYHATGRPVYRTHALECLDLFGQVFLQENCDVFEFFTDNWMPVNFTAQQLEPGHMVEWVYLIDRFEKVTGEKNHIELQRLFIRALDSLDSQGGLPDTSKPVTTTRRMWPQIELLKAAIVAERRGLSLANLSSIASPERVFCLLKEQYLSTPVSGGWYDKLDENGVVMSSNMPASTSYHIFVALICKLSTPNGHIGQICEERIFASSSSFKG